MKENLEVAVTTPQEHTDGLLDRVHRVIRAIGKRVLEGASPDASGYYVDVAESDAPRPPHRDYDITDEEWGNAMAQAFPHPDLPTSHYLQYPF